ATAMNIDVLTSANFLIVVIGTLVGILAGLGLMIVFRKRPIQLMEHVGAPPKNQLRPDGDPFLHGSRGERRTALRRKGAMVEVMLRDSEAVADLGRGWVIDRSMGGVRMTVDDSYETGDVLSVRPVKSPGTAPWLQLEVRSCQKKGSRWEIGCQFVRQPTWNLLMLFG